jgi:hypothetical protein
MRLARQIVSNFTMNSYICSSLLKREHNNINGTDAAEAIVGSFKYTLARRSASETAFAALSLVCLASTVKKSKSNTL